MPAAMHFSISLIWWSAAAKDSTRRVRALTGRRTTSTMRATMPPIMKAIQRFRKFSVAEPGTVSSSVERVTTQMLTMQTMPAFGYLVPSWT